MFKRKKKKTGTQVPPQGHIPTMPALTYPPHRGSNVQPPKQPCSYETPCGWCTKWDKKCDKKIGCNTDNNPQRGLRAKAGIFLDDAMDSELDDIRSGKGLSRLDANLDPNKPLPLGLRWEVRG